MARSSAKTSAQTSPRTAPSVPSPSARHPLRVALALGSGGARGYAHLGVIAELRERGHEIVAISGTSMGAVVGGLAAVGRDGDFAAWASGLRQRDVIRLMDFKFSAPGAVAADRLLGEIGELFGDAAIEDLPLAFTAVATDLGSRREVWFQQGPLLPAVRASFAIPGFFTPVMINGRLLVDGGLLNPVPVAPTAGVPADLTIASSLLGRRTHPAHPHPAASEPAEPELRQAPSPESSAPQRREEWRGRLRRTVAGLTGRDSLQVPDADDPPVETPPVRTVGTQPLPKDLRLTEVTGASFEAMQALVLRFRQAAFPADVTVDIPIDACRTLDFHRAAELIELGRGLTAQALDAAGIPPDAA